MNKQASIIDFQRYRHKQLPHVFFNRTELQKIMNVYGGMVSAGIWRDYAFHAVGNKLGFAVFQRTTDRADYIIFKESNKASQQGAYSILGREGQVIKRGHDLEALLKFFNTKRMKLVP